MPRMRVSFRYEPRYVISIQFPRISKATEFYDNDKFNMEFLKAFPRFTSHVHDMQNYNISLSPLDK